MRRAYLTALGEMTYADLQGTKLTLSTEMCPATRCCLFMGCLYLGRARALEVLDGGADVDLLKLERLSLFGERESTLDWLADPDFPVVFAGVPGATPNSPIYRAVRNLSGLSSEGGSDSTSTISADRTCSSNTSC